MGLGGSKGHPSHIYYQLSRQNSVVFREVGFREIKTDLKILIYGIFLLFKKFKI